MNNSTNSNSTLYDDDTHDFVKFIILGCMIWGVIVGSGIFTFLICNLCGFDRHPDSWRSSKIAYQEMENHGNLLEMKDKTINLDEEDPIELSRPVEDRKNFKPDPTVFI